MDSYDAIISKIDARAKSNTHQIEEIKDCIKELKEHQDIIYDLATSTKVLAEKMGNIEKIIDETTRTIKADEKRFEEYTMTISKNKNDLIDKIKIAIITAVCSSIGVTIITKILSLSF